MPKVKRGRVLRPIEREQWSDERDHSAILAINQATKLSAGMSQYRRRFNTASSGQTIAGSVGGGVYEPIQAPQTPGGNHGST